MPSRATSPLLPDKLYGDVIGLAVVDPEARAQYAARPYRLRAANEAILPAHAEDRRALLADLEGLVTRGETGRWRIVAENLRELYLVAIGGLHRVSRKLYVTHPALPGRLLVIGGVGSVRPSDDGAGLILETPEPSLTLHQRYPDLPPSAMSAACPTARKTIASIPNEDPLGGYSLAVAEAKFRYAAGIAAGSIGIDPTQFPVITNLAWGTVGDDVAWYAYALPGNAVPVCERLHAEEPAGVPAALAAHLGANRQFMAALRHLHGAGYVFNQPHQGNLYVYPDAKGHERIVIADLDTLQSVRDFGRKVPPDQYLSPRAFAALVNLQVAATHAASLAWFDLVAETIGPAELTRWPGADRLYASIVTELLGGYIEVPAGQAAAMRSSVGAYYRRLCQLVPPAQRDTQGLARLTNGALYETDLFGFLFTYILLDAGFCREMGARSLTEGVTQSYLERVARASLQVRRVQPTPQAMAAALDQAMNRIIEERSGQAMDKFLQAMRRRTRVSPRARGQV